MTILVAEDDKSVLNILLRVISEMDPHLELLSAKSGSEALQVALGKHVDLLVTDHGMVPGDGIFLSKRLLERNPQVIIFMMSGSVHLSRYVNQAGAHKGFDKSGGLNDLFSEVGKFVRGEFKK